MAPKHLPTSDFNSRRLKDDWIRVAQFGEFQEFANFVN
jgi:hypothetical protein